MTSPCRADRTRVAGKRSERIQPIGRFANAEMFSLVEKTDYSRQLFHIVLMLVDCCWR